MVVKAEQLVFSIEKNLVGYAQSAAFVTGVQGKNAFKPVFSNTLTSDDNGALSMRNGKVVQEQWDLFHILISVNSIHQSTLIIHIGCLRSGNSKDITQQHG